jgi:hypothetical protein
MPLLRTESLIGHTRGDNRADSWHFAVQPALVFLLLGSGVVNSAGATNQTQGAGYSDRPIKLLERTTQQPGQGNTPITFIIEADEPPDRILPIITADVLLASRAALGLVILSDAEPRGRVAPLVDGSPQPVVNTPLNAADLLLIERKALGVVNY